MEYEYKEFRSASKDVFRWVNGYSAFGWQYVETEEDARYVLSANVRLQRPSALVNKTELLRLEAQFESCRHEIERYEKSIEHAGQFLPIGIGIAGVLCLIPIFLVRLPVRLVFAVLAAVGLTLPFLLAKKLMEVRRQQTAPFILQKEKEIEEIKKKAAQLL